jgi:four helix bundle protein
MNNENLKKRTKRFALEIIKFVESLPSDKTWAVLGRQLLRSGTSVGANYRAACRAKSPADFIFKMGIVEEEADESSFWIELLLEAEKISGERLTHCLKSPTSWWPSPLPRFGPPKKRANQIRCRKAIPFRAPHSAFRVKICSWSLPSFWWR